MDLKINELEISKLNLQPGEVLFVKVKSDDVAQHDADAFGYRLREIFPNNKVIVVALQLGDDIELTIVKDSSIVKEDSLEGE